MTRPALLSPFERLSLFYGPQEVRRRLHRATLIRSAWRQLAPDFCAGLGQREACDALARLQLPPAERDEIDRVQSQSPPGADGAPC